MGHFCLKTSMTAVVTLALVLDSSGFSRRSRSFPGNVSEPGSLQKMIESVRSTPEHGKQQEATGKISQRTMDRRTPPAIAMDDGIA